MTSKNKTKILLGVFACTMIASSGYMLSHFYSAFYPDTLGSSSSFCDISNSLNCDKATYSALSSFYGVPIAFFGILLGIFHFIALFLKNFSKSLFPFSILNGIGVIFLAIYSLIFLKGMCPVCSIYWISSLVSLFALFKLKKGKINIATIIVISTLFLVSSSVLKFNLSLKNKKLAGLKEGIMKQYNDLKVELYLLDDSPLFFTRTGENNFDSKIHITVISDFQCPACSSLVPIMKNVEKRYKGNINIQFYPFPLSSICNKNVKTVNHAYSCQASKIVICKKDKFVELHDEIYANRNKLSNSYIQKIVKRENIEDCFNDPKTDIELKAMVDEISNLNITSTPTMIINNKKIEGVLPFNQLSLMLDGILEQANEYYGK